jgi:hypothetical protein
VPSALFVHPVLDQRVMAGNGTIALEVRLLIDPLHSLLIDLLHSLLIDPLHSPLIAPIIVYYPAQVLEDLLIEIALSINRSPAQSINRSPAGLGGSAGLRCYRGALRGGRIGVRYRGGGAGAAGGGQGQEDHEGMRVVSVPFV